MKKFNWARPRQILIGIPSSTTRNIVNGILGAIRDEMMTWIKQSFLPENIYRDVGAPLISIDAADCLYRSALASLITAP
jgi:phosphate/sulfate permease